MEDNFDSILDLEKVPLINAKLLRKEKTSKTDSKQPSTISNMTQKLQLNFNKLSQTVKTQ